MMRLTDVVKQLIIINVLFFVGTYFTLGNPTAFSDLVNGNDSSLFWEWKRYVLALFMPGSTYFEPVQLVTHMFMHADFMHLFFNMIGIFIFGPPLESLWGPKKFLMFYFLAGAGAFLLHLGYNYWQVSSGAVPAWMYNIPMLGASGCLLGLVVGAGIKFPNNQLLLLFPPIPIKFKWLAIIYVASDLFLGLGNFNTGIAHFAHLGGAIAGFLVILLGRW